MFELLVCHFSVMCFGNILKPLGLSFLVCKMELIPIQGLLRGSNVTMFEKHKVDTSLYGKRARKRAKNETNTTKAIVKQLSTQPQNVYLFL